MNELDTRTGRPCGASSTGLAFAWVLTPDGLRMQWTLEDTKMQAATIEIAAVRQTQPALAA